MSFADAMRASGYGTDPAGDAARREELSAAAITAEEWRALRAGLPAAAPEPYPAPVVAGHELTFRHGKAGTEVTCECGRWEGWYNGPRSRRRVLDDWSAHAATELRAAGPIIVASERLDTPREDT